MEHKKIHSFLIMAKLSDGTIRQVVTTKLQQQYLVSLLMKTSNDGKILISEETLEGVDWESDFKLY